MIVTVAICTWNRSAALRQTLEQLTNLRVPIGVEWELIVVNNLCTDDTDAVVAGFSGRLPIRRLSEPTPGLAHARNLVAREAKGDYLLWTDDDTIVDPGWMISLLKAFEEYRADWVFGRSFPVWESRAPGWFSHRFHGYFALLDYGSSPFVVADLDHPFYGLNNGCRRDALRQLGHYRPEFGLVGNVGGVGEDMDMFARALHAGMRIVYSPDAIVHHVIPASRTTKRLQRRKAWIGSEAYLLLLQERSSKFPWLLGVPRYLWRLAFDDAAACLKNNLTADWGEAFYHELRLIRFGGLLYAARRNRSVLHSAPAGGTD
jgi:glycosyltransferase involved in cell wall biosynthesis